MTLDAPSGARDDRQRGADAVTGAAAAPAAGRIRVGVWLAGPGARSEALAALAARLGELTALDAARDYVLVSRTGAAARRAATERVRHAAVVPGSPRAWALAAGSLRARHAGAALARAHIRVDAWLSSAARSLAADATPTEGGPALRTLVRAALGLPPLAAARAGHLGVGLLAAGALLPLEAADRWLARIVAADVARTPVPRLDQWVTPLDGPLGDGPTLLVVDRSPDELPPPERERARAVLAARPPRATLVVATSPALGDDLATRHGVPRARLRVVDPRRAADWLEALEEARAVAAWPPGLDEARDAPWPAPAAAPAALPDPPEVLLFLQEFAAGGVLEATRDLVRGLAALAAERGQVRLRLGVLARDDASTRDLARLADVVPVERFRLAPLTRREARRLLGGEPPWLASGPESYVSFGDAAGAALRADAWLALTDRFPLPLLPARPYGVVVYDLIQRHLPGAFDAEFHARRARGMAPTARAARLVITTSPATRADVIAEYGLDPARVCLVPVTHPVGRRFRGLAPADVPGVRAPFILNVTNASPHKGADRLVRGFARLRARTAARVQLVVCGHLTEGLSPRCPSPPSGHARAVGALVDALGLVEPDDVLFLGFVSDAQLAHLLARAAVVVNAALHDNGSFCLTEGRYFGRPTASTRYAAAEFLCERFAVPARFFAADDPDDLARALDEALRLDRPLTPAELAAVRAGYEAPELGHDRYVERYHDLLVGLAREGRAARAGGAAPDLQVAP